MSAEPNPRIIVAGGPRTGKTTFAKGLGERYGLKVQHTDDLIQLGWSGASAAAAAWFDEPGPWIVEGVAVPRAIRKWLAANPTGKPCDYFLWLQEPKVHMTRGQIQMSAGCLTVWLEVKDQLLARGVREF